MANLNRTSSETWQLWNWPGIGNDGLEQAFEEESTIIIAISVTTAYWAELTLYYIAHICSKSSPAIARWRSWSGAKHHCWGYGGYSRAICQLPKSLSKFGRSRASISLLPVLFAESRLRETSRCGAFVERVIARFKLISPEMIWGYYLEKNYLWIAEKEVIK